MIPEGNTPAGLAGEAPLNAGSQGAARRRTIALVAAAAVIVVVAAVFILGWTGHMFLWTTDVQLPPPTPQGDLGTAYYTAQFDGGVVNEFSQSEAAQGTAQVTCFFSTPEAGRGPGYMLEFQLWHAMETRVRNLHLRIDTPQEWGDLMMKLPGGDGWGSITHRVDVDGLTVDFDRLGWGSEGYNGTVFLSFRPEYGEAPATWGGTFRVEAEFDMNGTGLRRFVRWRVHGNWEIPVNATITYELKH